MGRPPPKTFGLRETVRTIAALLLLLGPLLAGCVGPAPSGADAAVAYLADQDPQELEAVLVLEATGGLVDPAAWPRGEPLLDRITVPERYPDRLRLADGVQRHGLDARTALDVDLVQAAWAGHDGDQFGSAPSLVDDAWALRVLGAAGVSTADERIQDAVRRLAAAQAEDGGWSWDGGPVGDTDVTVWVIEGLAAVGGLSAEARGQALRFLDRAQTASDLWGSLGVGANCQSTGLALWGYHVLAADAPEGGVVALRDCQNMDGGFPHRPGGASMLWVTADVLPALAAYEAAGTA